MFRFEDPEFLFLMFFVPIIVWRYVRNQGTIRVRFSSISPLKKIRRSTSHYLRHGLIILRCLALILLVAGLARPQSGHKSTEILTEGIDIVLCLDTSGSMQAMDFTLEKERRTRLEVVKQVVENFVKKRSNDRIGMVVFGEQAFTQCPLTLDYGVLLSFLKRVEIGMAGDTTALGSALATSVKRLKDVEAKSRVVILLTDGRNNAGRLSPETAAEIAQSYRVKVYTIGVGTEGKAPFLVDSFFGKQYVWRKVDLDEDTLRMLANRTDGTYFRATNTEALERTYQDIDQMEKTQVKVKEYMEYEELFVWFVFPGLFLVLLEITLANTRFRKIP
jgi:Ca-activated chloride channel family protein